MKNRDKIEFSIPDCDDVISYKDSMVSLLDLLGIEYHYAYARSIVYPNIHYFSFDANHPKFDDLLKSMKQIFASHPMKERIYHQRYSEKEE